MVDSLEHPNIDTASVLRAEGDLHHCEGFSKPLDADSEGAEIMGGIASGIARVVRDVDKFVQVAYDEFSESMEPWVVESNASWQQEFGKSNGGEGANGNPIQGRNLEYLSTEVRCSDDTQMGMVVMA